MSKKVTATSAQLSRALLSLKGVPLSFENYKPFEMVYDLDPDIMVLKAGRQVGKSVSLAGRTVVKSVARSYFNSLYVAPLQIQSKRFSSAYLDTFIESPLIKRHFTNTFTTRNVYEKSFNNGSTVYLSYAENENDADRIRGIMADQLTVDEVQDVSYDALPPIFEILSASDYGYKILAGTSKSVANTLEQLWLNSNMLEWVIKCPHCGHWIIPHEYDTCLRICQHDHGPSCDKCGKIIDVSTGQWVSLRPEEKRRIGFHLPQFMMGSNTTAKKWPRLHEKVIWAETGGLYSPVKLANEVFGIATDLAGKAITVKEAMDCCNPEWTEVDSSRCRDYRGFLHYTMGVDWSVSGSTKSYTVVTIQAWDHLGKMHLVYSERLQGIHILKQVDRVAALFTQFNCDFMGSDRGVGVLQGQLLQQKLGKRCVVMINYVSAKLKLRYDTKGEFLAADRTQAIDNVIQKIRMGRDRFECPRYERMEAFWKDGLAIFEEETLAGNRVYRHHPDEPDDWLHSLVFGNIAYQYMTGDYTFTE